MKYLQIIPKLSYIEKNVWLFIYLGWHLREEVSEGARQCQGSSQCSHWDALGWSALLVTLVLGDSSTILHADSLQSYFFQHICPICFIQFLKVSFILHFSYLFRFQKFNKLKIHNYLECQYFILAWLIKILNYHIAWFM